MFPSLDRPGPERFQAERESVPQDVRPQGQGGAGGAGPAVDFEAASGPLNEAFMAGAPAACSNVTSVPEQAGDSALVFDPHCPDQIADAIFQLWTNPNLRQTLIARGRANVARFTWQKTARHFRAHYRKLANRPLTDEDQELLTAPPQI